MRSTVHAEENITAVHIGGYDFKVNFCLTLIQPRHSVPWVIKLIDTFGALSGYEVNYNKSEAIPLRVTGVPWNKHPDPQDFGCKWATTPGVYQRGP